MNKRSGKIAELKQAKKFSLKVIKQARRIQAELAAGAMLSIYKGADIGQGRSILTADEQKRLAPTRLDKMEARILKMLAGWSILDIECLLVHRVVPEAKRRAKVPK